MSAERFAQAVVDAVAAAENDARFLVVRARGKTAVIGYDDSGEWVPLFRIAHGSGAYNVADLQVRHGRAWEPTHVRGVPVKIAEELVGPLRFLWEMHAQLSQQA